MRTLGDAISHMMHTTGGEIIDLKTAVGDVVLWEKEMKINPCPSGGGLGFAMNEVETAGRANPQGVWDILRSGTDDEFSALCNCLPEIGGEFDRDDVCREIMCIAKRRMANTHDRDSIMMGLKGCLGALFDKFWNETVSVDGTRPSEHTLYGK